MTLTPKLESILSAVFSLLSVSVISLATASVTLTPKLESILSAVFLLLSVSVVSLATAVDPFSELSLQPTSMVDIINIAVSNIIIFFIFFTFLLYVDYIN